MKTIFLLLTLAVLCTGCVDQTADTSGLSDGHETGNGTDNVSFQGAWVAGENSEIKYCVKMGKDFGVEKSVVLTQIEAAFQKWFDYIESKKVNEQLEKTVLESFARSTYPPRDPNEIEIARTKLFHLPLKKRMLPICDGSQNVSFHLGYFDSISKRLFKKYENPTAYAELVSAKPETGNGQGIIWLVKEGGLIDGKAGYPMWELKNRLLGVLMHEIGHVYGVGHIEDTIMQKDMWGLLLNHNHTTVSQESIEYMMEHIDHSNELYINYENNNSKYEGDLAYNFSDVVIQDGIDTFLLFTGKVPVGKLTSTFINNKLTLSDEEQSFSFPVTVVSKHYTSNDSVFSVQRIWKLPEGTTSGQVGLGTSLYHTEMVQVGEIETSSGEKLSVELEFSQGRPFYISYLKNQKSHSLLVMKDLR